MIRDVLPGDAAAITDIYNYYIRNTVITFEEIEITREDIIERIDRVHQLGLPWIVAEDNGNVIGYAYAGKWRERNAYRFTVEIAVYLSGKYHSQGWGSRLMQVLLAKLKQVNVHAVIGVITLPNDASVALHEKFGMSKVAHFPEVGRKFDQWLDVGFWQGIL